MNLISQSQTAQPLLFLLIDETDHITGLSGLSPAVTLSKNGGAFAGPAGTVTEVGNGWYKIAGNATDANTLGPLVLHATASGADPVDVLFTVVAFNPQDALRLGLSALPGANAGASGGLPVGNGSGHVTLADSSLSVSKQASDWRVKLSSTQADYAPSKAGDAMTLQDGALTQSKIGSDLRVKLAASQPDYAPAKTGEAMALTSSERSTLAAAIEAAIIDDTDGDALLQAIQDKIAGLNPTWGELTVGTIASAARDAVLDALIADHGVAGSVAQALAGIRAKTDSLPADPASESAAADNRAALINAVGTPLQAASYQTPPSAVTIAVAVWSTLDRSLTAFDFETTATVDESALFSAVANAVSESLGESTWSAQDVQQARYQLGLEGTALAPLCVQPHLTVALSQAGIAQLTAERQIAIKIPTLMGQQLSDPLIQGDSYSAELESALEFARNDFPDIPAGSTCRLSARKRNAEGTMSGFVISAPQASVQIATGTKVLQFEATSEQTREWEPGKYEFDVEVIFPDGEARTFLGPNVFLRVLADVSDQ